MPIEQPSCCYHKIFDEKREDARNTYDFSLTAGFQSGARWIHPKHPDEILEFSLKQAEVQLGLENGTVDLEEGKNKTELESDNFAVQVNLSDSRNPFWMIKPFDIYLSGNLTRVALCTVTAGKKCNFSYNSKIIVQPIDIVITRMPNSWVDSLPFKGLRTQKIKLRIVDVISKTSSSLETENALTA